MFLTDDQDSKAFVVECLGCAIVDSGCPSTVCGSLWLQAYTDSLSANQKQLIEVLKCSKKYRFGHGNEVEACKSVRVPVFFGKTKATLTINVVPIDIPLLLSKDSLEKGRAEINFGNNTMNILNTEVPLRETNSGHLLLPLCRSLDAQQSYVKRILFNSAFESDSDKELKKKALKLHRQFAHPPPYRLQKLLKDSNIANQKLLKFVDEVSKECKTCQELQSVPNKPVVGFPLATEFNETVAMDLKVFKTGIYIHHMIDHAARYSSGCIIFNKRKETIVEGILTHWVKWFWSTQKAFI